MTILAAAALAVGLPPASTGSAGEPLRLTAGSTEGRSATALPEAAGALRPDQIDAILAALDDQQVRAAFREMLVRQAPAEAARASGAPEPNLLEIYQSRLAAIMRVTATLPDDLDAALHRRAPDGHAIEPARLAGVLAGLILVGGAARLATRRLLAPSRQRLEQVGAATGRSSVVRTLLRLLYALVEIGSFALMIVCGYLILSPTDPRAPQILYELLRLSLAVLLATKLSEFIIAPAAPALRWVPIGDGVARRLHAIAVGVATLLAVGVGLVRVLTILDLSWESLAVVSLTLSIIVFTVLLALIWGHRRPVEQAIRRRIPPSSGLAHLAGHWALAASAYVVVLWLLSVDAIVRAQTATAGKLAVSFLLFLGVPILADLIYQRLLRRFFDAPEEPGGQPPPGQAATGAHNVGRPQAAALEQRGVGTAAPLREPRPLLRLMWGVWSILALAAIVLTARIWGVTPTGLGGAAAQALLHVPLIVLLSYVGYQLLSTAFDRRLAQASRSDADPDADPKERRLATLLPLLRKFILTVVIVMVALTILSSLGVQIGPLLAGAGVVGLAIGLGAQSLVTDILAGIFFLIDDAFRVGDYIEIGPLRGTVESISIRSLKLRHHRGALHTIPFGQMKSLTNYSRDWVIMKLEIPVFADTDFSKVKKIVKKIGAELLADPVLGPQFLDPVKSQGVR